MPPSIARRVAAIGIAIPLLLSTAARADVVAVVSAHSTQTQLTRTQLEDIFLGRRTRFPDGTTAVPVDQREGSTARDIFYARFLGMSAPQLKSFWSKIIFTGRGQPPKALDHEVDVKKLVASEPATIGYIDQKLVDETVRILVVN